MLNRRYGRPAGIGGIEYAPRTFRENGAVVVPREDDDQAYFSRGWLKVIDVKPEYDPAKKYIVFAGWQPDYEQHLIVAQYEINDIEPAPAPKMAKRLSKLKITLFCMKLNIWNDVKKLLQKAGYYDLFLMAQYFLDNDEYFLRGVEMYKANFVHPGQEERFEKMMQELIAFAYDGEEPVEETQAEEQQEETQQEPEVQEEPIQEQESEVQEG